MQSRTTVQIPDWITEPAQSEIIFGPAECYSGCTNPSCPYIHGDSWWVDGVSYQTEVEAKAALAKARGDTTRGPAMQLTVSETAPHIWSVFDDPYRARAPLAQFTDELDAELWAAARDAAEIMRGGPKRVRLLNTLADAAQRGHREVLAFRADAA